MPLLNLLDEGYYYTIEAWSFYTLKYSHPIEVISLFPTPTILWVTSVWTLRTWLHARSAMHHSILHSRINAIIIATTNSATIMWVHRRHNIICKEEYCEVLCEWCVCEARIMHLRALGHLPVLHYLIYLSTSYSVFTPFCGIVQSWQARKLLFHTHGISHFVL